MRASSPSLDYAVRPYVDEDESKVLDLLRATRADGPGASPNADSFRWKHRDNPFGRSLMLVAEREGAIIGLRAFMRWRFRVGGTIVRAAQAVDAATHPDHQRMGVFSHLTREALTMLRDDTDLVYNTPNEKSLPGNLKIGWRTAGRFPVCIRVRHPIRFAKGFRSVEHASGAVEDMPSVGAPTAADVLADANVVPLLARLRSPADRFSTDRDLGYLRWRYVLAPHLDYRAVTYEQGGLLQGLGIFRVRARGTLKEAVVADVIAAPDDARAMRSLLRQVAHASDVDHLTCCFPRGSTLGRAATAAAFFRSPARITVVVNPLRPGLRPDPTAVSSWGFCLGDLEVF